MRPYSHFRSDIHLLYPFQSKKRKDGTAGALKLHGSSEAVLYVQSDTDRKKKKKGTSRTDRQKERRKGKETEARMEQYLVSSSSLATRCRPTGHGDRKKSFFTLGSQLRLINSCLSVLRIRHTTKQADVNGSVRQPTGCNGRSEASVHGI